MKPGGWSFWQIRMFRFAITSSVIVWILSDASLPSTQVFLFSVLALTLTLGTRPAAIPARVASVAILVLFVVLVPGRDTPPLPLYAALAWCALAGADRISIAGLVAGQLFAVISICATFATSTGQPAWHWIWIGIALPALIPPSAIPGKKTAAPERLFYDGHCGLCHHAIQFLLAEDSDGRKFRFAPLDSDAFRATVPEDVRKDLPDSVVVFTADGRTLCRSTAAIHVFHRLGGYWRALAILAGPIPSSLLDAFYDGVARIRHRLFKPPTDVCPLMPKELRARFDY